MQDRYESPIDRQIREAQERGEFDNLPGFGKPLPGSGQPLHDDWWLKEMVHREQIGSGGLPTTLRLRKECEDVADLVATRKSEAQVRAYLADLNERIRKAMRGPVDGPPIVLKPLEVEQVVQEWRNRRAG
ncbi:DUF1992 domain-containing protein [Rhizocola hellebori]|uniref:DUF1992 domain-containing protein n=1 Tax=Rhizocola hellebori TaxID=1392758 RepID=A0A8J3VGJ5_9ACTN|nr:DUF1992 domain-containing protein [Rhizocola hellebori]GIH05111.1 DUF1992 domain-containing protein [Rhizocola hellebori]